MSRTISTAITVLPQDTTASMSSFSGFTLPFWVQDFTSLGAMFEYSKLHTVHWIYLGLLLANLIGLGALYRFYLVNQPPRWGRNVDTLKSWMTYVALHLLVWIFSTKGCSVQWEFEGGSEATYGFWLFFVILSCFFIRSSVNRAQAAVGQNRPSLNRSFSWVFPMGPWIVIYLFHLVDWLGDNIRMPYTRVPEHAISPPGMFDLSLNLFIFLVLEAFVTWILTMKGTFRRAAYWSTPLFRTYIEIMILGSPASHMSIWHFTFLLLPATIIFCLCGGDIQDALLQKVVPAGWFGIWRRRRAAQKVEEQKADHTV